MAVFEMSLPVLRAYQGVNPKPDDFDVYWDESIAEMHALGVSSELIEANFQAPGARCFDLYFTGVRGARVHSKLLIPTGNNASANASPANGRPANGHPAVIQFHGYSLSSGDWFDKLAFAASGFVVAAMDCRGQGGSSEDVGGYKWNTLQGHIIRGLDDVDQKKMLMRDIFLDTAQLARIVMSLPEVDASRVGAYGASQGGGLTLACAALEPSIKRLCPMYPFLCDYRRVWDMDLAENAYLEIRDYFRRFDVNHLRENEIFTRLGYIDVQHLAPRIRGDVLMYTSLMDKICPPSTQFAAYNKITSRKEMMIWPDFEHEHLPGANDRTFQHMLGL